METVFSLLVTGVFVGLLGFLIGGGLSIYSGPYAERTPLYESGAMLSLFLGAFCLVLSLPAMFYVMDQKAEDFMRACGVDHKQYECIAMYRGRRG